MQKKTEQEVTAQEMSSRRFVQKNWTDEKSAPDSIKMSI